MIPTTRLLVALLAFTTTLLAYANRDEDAALIAQAIDRHLENQVKGLPGKASYSIGAISGSHRVADCDRLDVGSAPGARSWGRTHVSVRCAKANATPWSLFVSVQIKIISPYLASARPLTLGQILSEADFQTLEGDLSDLPAGVVTESAQALGKVMTASLPSGRPFRTDMMRHPTLIQQGQSVKVTTTGPGFQAANEGRALNNAALGQVAQVRLASGQVISGLVQSDGVVTIKF